MLITTGSWGWVHSFEHRHCDENHQPVQQPDPENCHICYELQFTIKNFETNTNTIVVSDLDFGFYVLQRADQLIDESWEVCIFTRRGPPSA